MVKLTKSQFAPPEFAVCAARCMVTEDAVQFGSELDFRISNQLEIPVIPRNLECTFSGGSIRKIRTYPYQPLLRARAIENQCYVVAAAQCGAHNEKRQSYGHAMIVDPWGTVVAHCQDGPGIALAEIDLRRLEYIRTSMPVQSHRRHDLYSLLPAPSALDRFSADSYSFGGHPVQKGSVFYETSLTLAFVNLKPVVPGHVLMIPKRCVEKFMDLQPEETGDLFHVVQLVETMLLRHYEVSSATVCIQDGFDAGQTVKHVHVHLLPRRPKDFEGDDVYKEMDSHDKGENRKPRSQEQMSAEAAIYRGLLLSSL